MRKRAGELFVKGVARPKGRMSPELWWLVASTRRHNRPPTSELMGHWRRFVAPSLRNCSRRSPKHHLPSSRDWCSTCCTPWVTAPAKRTSSAWAMRGMEESMGLFRLTSSGSREFTFNSSETLAGICRSTRGAGVLWGACRAACEERCLHHDLELYPRGAGVREPSCGKHRSRRRHSTHVIDDRARCGRLPLSGPALAEG
jgi:hypothetical protein